MKLCDIAGFFSATGGGVKTYHTAKSDYFAARPEHTYVMIVASHRNAVTRTPSGRLYEVRGFPVSKNRAYRQIYDLAALRRIVALEQPDIVEAGSPYADCLLARLAGFRTRAKTVGFYHADVPDSYIAPAVRPLPKIVGNAAVAAMREYIKHTYRHLDATVVTSRHIYEKLTGLGLSNVRRVPLGTDTVQFTPAKRSEALRRSLGVKPDEALLLFAGRFRKEKGIETLAQAIRELDVKPGVKTVLVGDGPHGEGLRAAAAECRNVILSGYETDIERLSVLYASSDLFLAPGPHETFGLAVLEAMSAGLPVVGADQGGTAELISASGSGALFRSNNADDLVRQIDGLLTGNLSAHRLQARHFAVSRYSWRHTFDRMVQVYGELFAA